MAEDDVPVPAFPRPFVVPTQPWNGPLAPFHGSFTTTSFKNGTFQTQGLAPVDYGIILRDLPDGYALADILYGNASVGDLPFHPEGIGQLTLVVTSKAGAISGTIHGADDHVPPTQALLLVPDSFGPRSSMLRILQAESDSHGAFGFRNLASGKYRLMILKSQSLNPASIAALMPDGQTVEVRPSATTAVTVELR